MRRSLIAATIAAVLTAAGAAGASAAEPSLWQLYDQSLQGARYVDLTHTITPSIPVWAGFGPSQFAPSINPATGNPYTYKADGFEATRYTLATDQLGTQLDPPRTGRPSTRRSTSCRPPSRCARWSSSRSCPRSARTSTTR